MARGRLLAVIGGQYGSEGKGVVVNHIATREEGSNFDIHVRVGSHNAGHSFQRDGRIWKMQQIPVGWVNPEAELIIGRGALVSPETLLREMKEIEKVDSTIWDRVLVDADAGILDEHHHDAEGGVEGEIHNRIGSTGEGVGAARIARLRREPYHVRSWQDLGAEPTKIVTGFRHFRDLVRDSPEYRELTQLICENTPLQINTLLKDGADVLLEGSQGVGLSLVHGPWPYVTTTDCGAAQLCADVGVPPMWLTEVLCVVRTFPIRVSGNSGPLEHEITWEDLSKRLGRNMIEHTTVTKKIRRIGEWDSALVDQAVVLNAPTSFALMFTDYLDMANLGVSEFDDLTEKTKMFIWEMEDRWDIPVQFIGTGGVPWTVIEQ